MVPYAPDFRPVPAGVHRSGSIEQVRTKRNAYDDFADTKITVDSAIISFNYDVALERALANAGKWDIGNGYGFTFLSDRPASEMPVYKLHGSVNWFKSAEIDIPRPIMFERELSLLGYHDVVDPRVPARSLGVESSATLILPQPDKMFYWGDLWEPLWKAAAEHLRRANEVFIHGYSMPSVDVRARELLFTNIQQPAAIRIHCRNDSERIAVEFRNRGFTDVQPFSCVGFEAWAASRDSIAL